MSLAVHYSSDRDDWCTPEDVLTRVRFVGDIGLDPCSNDESIVGASFDFGFHDDGLNRNWAANVRRRQLVYVNPPYGREIGHWMRKCADEAQAGADIIALVPARTDTVWFRVCWDTAASICFWRGRLTFLGAPHPAPFPSAAVLWTDSVKVRTAFRGAFWTAGRVVTL